MSAAAFRPGPDVGGRVGQRDRDLEVLGLVAGVGAGGEVGYVGRDVESMIRDLTELAINMVKEEEKEKVQVRARELAEERVLDLLLPPARTTERRVQPMGDAPRPSTTSPPRRRATSCAACCARASSTTAASSSRSPRRRCPMVEVFTPQGMEEMEFHLKDMFANLMPKKTKKQRRHASREALDLLTQEEADQAARHGRRDQGGDPPRRAVGHHLHRRDRQDRRPRRASPGPTSRARACSAICCRSSRARTVNTKYGMVRTDHILFIASGAFHMSKPSDLIPEFQGRFPIRVELDAADARGLRPHPHRAGQRADQAVRGADGDRGRHAHVHATTPSTRSPTSPRGSTSAPRTSAPAACTRSWNACLTRSPSTRQKWPSARWSSTPRTSAHELERRGEG